MVELQFVSDFVYRHFERVSVSSNGTHFLARCALCGDSAKNKSKKRFNLDYNNGNPIWHCFNCGESGSFLEIYSRLEGMTIAESMKELFGYNPDRLIQRLSTRKKEKVIKEIQYESHNWIMDDCIGLNMGPIGSVFYPTYLSLLKEFYSDRKIDEDFDIFLAYKGDYKGRFIIPVYDGDKITYFQARKIPGTDLLPKYKNPTLTKGGVILNKDKFDRDKYIIVTEGIIDAYTIGNQGTCSFGVSITEDFLKELFSLTDMGIIIALDNDKPGYDSLKKFMLGYHKRRRVVDKNKYSSRVKYFLFPDKYKRCKDINKIKVDYDIVDVYDMIVDSSYDYSAAIVNLKLNKLF